MGPATSSRRRLLAGIVLGLGLSGVAARAGAGLAIPGPPGPVPRPEAITCRSPALNGRLPAEVYLPRGYRGGSARYPVIYLLHGLPDDPGAYRAYGYLAQRLRAASRPALLVIPQGARRPWSDREYLDWDQAEDWPRAIALDLTNCIDHRYRTVPDRTGRALIGFSAGGYGALNIGLRWLSRFGAVESWSGYTVATDPDGLHALRPRSPRARAIARVPRDRPLASALRRWPALLAFYVGSRDSRFRRMNERYDGQLRAGGIAHLFRVYPGGHSGSLWSAQAPAWFSLALDALAGEGQPPLAHGDYARTAGGGPAAGRFMFDRAERFTPAAGGW